MNDNDLITALRDSFTDVHSGTSVERIVTRSRAVRARRRIPGSAGALAVVAAVVLAVIMLVPASHQTRSHPRIQLVAWTVVKLPNGDIRVHIFRLLRHPAALQRKLRSEGIPASIVTHRPGLTAAAPCRQYPASQTLLNKVFPTSYRLRPPPWRGIIVIRPSALPSAVGVQLAGSLSRGEVQIAAPILVHTSPHCTGS